MSEGVFLDAWPSSEDRNEVLYAYKVFMPRKARIDAPGALHHIIIRGIERRRIFSDDQDRDNFVERLGVIVTETKTFCFAWALIPSHAHILLRTGQTNR
jgi:REP element-mobilizing transposase RayT